MGRTFGTMLTMTTYGTWLRGDRRGWVEDGVVFPADVEREVADREGMEHAPWRFAREDLELVGGAILASLRERMRVGVGALTVQTWHVHVVIGPTERNVADLVKCAKDAARYRLRPGRPIWTDGYDKRFCFDEAALVARMAYVERHNVATFGVARPWPMDAIIE